MLARDQPNRFKIVVEVLIETDRIYAVKRRSIQNNLLLVCTIIEGVEDDTEAALINLDQS